jgi:regulator of protease activity HflC (stomatin/prohibitin superfamily)
MFVSGLILGLALVLVLTAAFSVFRVEEGTLAVLSAFGAARRSGGALVTFRPGLHVKRPWEKVHAVTTMEQSLNLSEDGGREAMAEDGTVLKLDASMRFAPTEAGLERYLFGIARPQKHLTQLFTALMRNELANVRASDAQQLGGSYALIRRDRKPLDQRIEAACREQLDGRYGVRFHAVDVTDIHPPDELAEALNAVIAANTHAEERYFRAESESRQRVLSAKEGVEIATARARAAEDEVLILGGNLRTLAEKKTLGEYVRRRKAEVLSESRALFFKEESR